MFAKGEESRVATSCPGFASYEVRSSGIVTVNGQVPSFAEGSAARQKLVAAWDRFQRPVASTSRRTGIPAPWLMGVMVLIIQIFHDLTTTPSICLFNMYYTEKAKQ